MKKNKGSALLVVLIVLSGMMIISFTANELMFRQLQSSANIWESVRAYQAADSGIEYALYEVFKNNNTSFDFNNICEDWNQDLTEVKYCLKVEEVLAGDKDAIKGESNITDQKRIRSIGKSGQVRRGLSVVLWEKYTPPPPPSSGE